MRIKAAKILGILLVLSLIVCLTGATAFADTDSVTINLNGATLTSYDSSDLEAFDTTDEHDYSTWDQCHSQYAYYTAYGPELEQVLTAALAGSGTTLSQVASIQITASDNYSVTLSKSNLLDTTRYYYATPTSTGVEVPAIIATQSGALGGTLSTTDCLRNFYGQTTSSDYTIKYFVKSISSINLITN